MRLWIWKAHAGHSTETVTRVGASDESDQKSASLNNIEPGVGRVVVPGRGIATERGLARADGRIHAPVSIESSDLTLRHPMRVVFDTVIFSDADLLTRSSDRSREDWKHDSLPLTRGGTRRTVRRPTAGRSKPLVGARHEDRVGDEERPGPAGSVAVRLEGVRKLYGDVVAVDGVDLDIPDGEFFSLLGPSGSGKTTRLRMIAGFEQPDRGTRAAARPRRLRLPPYDRDVNTVFQDYALFPHMTVGENVEYGLMVQGVPKARAPARADDALALVRLVGYDDRRPTQLSGGQRQRVALARALVTGRRCCCSTSRSARSTSSCARRCRSS